MGAEVISARKAGSAEVRKELPGSFELPRFSFADFSFRLQFLRASALEHYGVQVPLPVAPHEGGGPEEPVDQEYAPDEGERKVQPSHGDIGEGDPDAPHGGEGDQEDVVGIAGPPQAPGIDEG